MLSAQLWNLFKLSSYKNRLTGAEQTNIHLKLNDIEYLAFSGRWVSHSVSDSLLECVCPNNNRYCSRLFSIRLVAHIRLAVSDTHFLILEREIHVTKDLERRNFA
jgi:hypothetical protein